jgi:xylulokinase
MLLGLDLGTTNVKALVTDRAGRPLARGSCPVRLFHVGDDGVEQDLEEITTATFTAIRGALRSSDPADIEAIGISSQGGAMQVLDAQGGPLGRVISWLDQRGRRFDDALTAELGPEWFRRRIGHGRSGLAIGQVLRLRQERSGIFQASHRIGFVGDLIVSRLCGRAAHDGTSCGLTLLHNPGLRRYDPDVLARLQLEPEQLPDLVSPREIAAGLRPEVARETGLRAGIPVSAGIHDQYASALGAGAVRAGTVMVGTGTAWVLLAVSDRLPAPVIDEAFACTHVIEGLFGQILSLVNGGSAVTWALELMGLGREDARGIETLLAAAPAGSQGVSFWPFLVPSGASGLPPGTTGRWAGLQLSHRPAHLLRAVVEGLASELNRHLDFLRTSGGPLERLVMSGGAAAAGRVAPQIVADVTGLPVGCGNSGEASLLGAVIIARGLLEPEASLLDLVGQMVPPPGVVEPGPDALFYREQYQRYSRSLPGREANPT